MKNKIILFGYLLFSLIACKAPEIVRKDANKTLPSSFLSQNKDTSNSASLMTAMFFEDTNLKALINAALVNNQEINIMKQEIEIARNEIKAKEGEYKPFVNAGGASAVDKTPRYTSKGASDATNEIRPGKEFPEPLPDFLLGLSASWEVDIWHKLRNAKKSASLKYLSSIEGKNFALTQIVAEIANEYYELISLDNQLDILENNISIQKNALQIVKAEKDAARVTELAVKKFEAEVFKNQSKIFDIKQNIIERENKINFLVGRFSGPVERISRNFINRTPQVVSSGIPTQLLQNRPDIRKAELDLAAAKIDVDVAKANFLPSLRLKGAAGFQAYSPLYLFSSPQSILVSLGSEMMGPWINKLGITAAYNSANARQSQMVFNYQQAVLKAFAEVKNQLSMIDNLNKSYESKLKEVGALSESIDISTVLFKSARADYMEVLLTQRDALDAKFDLIENKKQQMNAMVNLYKALGGGWK